MPPNACQLITNASQKQITLSNQRLIDDATQTLKINKKINIFRYRNAYEEAV